MKRKVKAKVKATLNLGIQPDDMVVTSAKDLSALIAQRANLAVLAGVFICAYHETRGRDPSHYVGVKAEAEGDFVYLVPSADMQLRVPLGSEAVVARALLPVFLGEWDGEDKLTTTDAFHWMQVVKS